MISYFLYSYEDHEHLYGPGNRLVIWTQGCSIRCNGCTNEHLWSFSKDKIISDDDFFDLINRSDIEGITLLGGEPLDQSREIINLLIRIKKIGKSIILFTGYWFKQLKFKEQRKIWLLSDIVIAGPFILSKRNIYLQFRGSTNQIVYTHKGVYKNYQIHDGKTLSVIDINSDGSINLKGFDSENIIGNL